MGNPDFRRVWAQEGAYTFRSELGHKVLIEFDRRTSGRDCYVTITRTGGFITKTEYFADPARTDKIAERQFTRTAGYLSFPFITAITTIFYNADGSEDSRVTATVARTDVVLDPDIQQCNSPFSTSESTKL